MLKYLQCLKLNRCGLTDHGLKVFSHLMSLQILALNDCFITDQRVAEHLGHLTGVASLCLKKCIVMEQSLTALGNFKNREFLDLTSFESVIYQ